MSGNASRRKVIISGMLGNGLEWYDYALYGQMVTVFATHFFTFGSDTSTTTSLILTYLTFAAGFIARPLGAVIFGRIGDKYGRKKALTASMILMAIPTGCIGLLPTYAQIGIAAPILLLLIRITQGLSLGGAFSGSMSYVVEHADPKKRAVTGCTTMVSLVIGFLLGSFVATMFATMLSEGDFLSWGWRIPFFVGVLIGFVGFWIRNHGDESPIYKEAKASGALSDSPVKEAFTKYPLKMFQGFSFYFCVTIPFYCVAIYMIGYSKVHLGLTQDEALRINSMVMFSMLLPIFPAALLADKYGRRPVLIAGALALLVLVYPAFQLMSSGTFWGIAAGQSMLGFLNGFYLASIPAVLVELFPTRIRYTGMAMSYNFCAILGGLTPSFAELLIDRTGDVSSILYIFVVSALFSLSALVLYKDRYQDKLA